MVVEGVEGEGGAGKSGGEWWLMVIAMWDSGDVMIVLVLVVVMIVDGS